MIDELNKEYYRNVEIRGAVLRGDKSTHIIKKYYLTYYLLNKYLDEEQYTTMQNKLRKKINDYEFTQRMYEKGYSGKQIGKIIGCSTAHVYTMLKQMGLRDKKREKKQWSSIKDNVSFLLQQGLPLEDVADLYHINEATLRTNLLDSGISYSTRSDVQRAERNQRIINLYRDGYTAKEIQQIVGISLAGVYKVLYSYGVTDYEPQEERTKRTLLVYLDILKGYPKKLVMEKFDITENNYFKIKFKYGAYTKQELLSAFDKYGIEFTNHMRLEHTQAKYKKRV